MDLGTVKLRLERGAYPTAEDCAADVRLIWDNCRTYNTGGVPRDLHKASEKLAADALSKRFETRFAKMLAGGRPKSSSRGGGGSNGNGKGPAKPKGGGGGGGGSSASVAAAVAADPTTEDRRRLARHLGRARMEDVTAAVHEIDRGCPEALVLRRAGHQRKREEEEEGRSTGGGCVDGGGGGNDSVEALVGTTAAVEIEVDVDALDAWTFCAVERVVAPHAALRRASRVTAPRRARKKRPAAAPAAVPSSSGRSSSSAGRGGGGEGGAGAGDAAGAEAAEGRPSKRSRPACNE
ncbi:unnamed protein product [Ectocarpus sp. 6 AP-2014]